MATNAQFEVLISGGTTSVDEYRRAMSAPKSELPKLTEQQKFVAKKMGISEEEYRRGVLAEMYGESRMQERGRRLGSTIQNTLDGFGGGYRVEALQAQMVKFRWLVRIAGQDRELIVAVPRELADDVLDSGASDDLRRLKNCLLRELRNDELPAKG